VTFWIDAQLSPAPAPWLTQRFGVRAFSVKFLGFRDATDYDIFAAARDARAVVISKDSDIVTLLDMGHRRKFYGLLPETPRTLG
jgi:predicted nuclease of predicted toxin-antitoxin system